MTVTGSQVVRALRIVYKPRGALRPGSLASTQVGRDLTTGLVQCPHFTNKDGLPRSPAVMALVVTRRQQQRGGRAASCLLGLHSSHPVSCHLPV